MTHTQILSFIRRELIRQGIVWKNEKELFEMLLPDESWEKHRSNWDSWKNQKVQYLRKSFYILVKISKTLGFEPDVWNLRNEESQKKRIKEAIEGFCSRQKSIDLSEIMPPDAPMNSHQEEVLNKVLNLPNDKIIDSLENYQEYFENRGENQTFLLHLLSILYRKGMYDFLESKVFPALLPHNRADREVRMIMAHTFGSLSQPKYLEAAKLLETIKTEDDEELIDLKTATMSNIKREILLKPAKDEREIEEAFSILIRYYADIYKKVGRFHYYPGINLAYVVKLEKIVFPQKRSLYEISSIYRECKESIERDRNGNQEDLIFSCFVR